MANPEALRRALQCQSAGDLSGAARIYEAILADDPADAVALQFLGLNLSQGEDPERGVALLQEAVLIGDDALSHLVLGQAQFLAGHVADAVASYRRALLRDPMLAVGYAGLGRALRAQGALAEAEEALRRALLLAPQDAATHLELSALLREMERPVDAALAADAAIQLQPEDATAWTALGNALLEAGEAAAAVAAQTRAAALAPDLDIVQHNLGNALRAAGEEAAAEAAYRAAIRLRPDFAEAICGLAGVLYLQERFAAAEASARQAIALRADYADAFLMLGNAIQAQYRFAEAEAAYRAALGFAGREPRIAAAAWSNLCTALTAQERPAEAVAAADAALALRPDFANAAYNRAITLLTAGDYAAGWPAFEARWRISWSPPRGFAEPQWLGAAAGEDAPAIAGGAILVHAEQGLGDTLQFARYIPLLAARGARVILEVQAPLVRLLAAQPALAGVEVIERDLPLPPFDLHCPMMSLPLAFATTLASIPPAPYLQADPELVATWQGRLGFPEAGVPGSGPPLVAMPGTGLPPAGAPRIGLVWAGAPRIGYVNAERSIALAAFAPVIAAAPHAAFCALQLGADPAELAASGFELRNPMADVADFADTAAIVAGLDLVISVDTSVAHLAAAMGKPVWLLSRVNGCWRWLTGREDSPWYGSVRVYRQAAPGHWAPTLARLAADLRTAFPAPGAATASRGLTAA
jgi:tetratricopeptide (TPR) repeat protein